MRQLHDTERMAMPNSFPRRRRSSIRLWFSPTKGDGGWSGKGSDHISPLRIDRLLKRKISIRKRVPPSMQRYLDEEIFEFDLKEDYPIDAFIGASFGASFGEGKRSRVSGITFNPNSHTERRTLATGGVRVTRRPTCNQCPHPGQICNFQQYNLPKPSPPIPPRRSSSLPKESRVIECISNPTAPLTPFSLSTEDSYFLQFMLTGSLSKLDFFSKTKLWPMALHRFHTEPAIRHILLGTTMVHRQRAHPNDSQYGNPERSATRHYGKAIRLLSASLANVTQRLQGETREITILTTFLLAAFEILRRNDDRATYWMENGMKLLGRATNATPTLPTRKIEQDANSKQLAQAFEMMDVNLKIKRMKNSKRIQRSIGRCGAGGLSRRKLEKRRSCIGLFHPDG